jgi:hypothetical protein
MESLSRALTVVTLLLVAGCAALPWPQRSRPGGATALPDGRLDLRGAVHVHTRSSRVARGSVRELLRGARDAGLAWIALTEHTRPGGPPPSGTMDGVVVIPGFEMKAWGGSLLGLGVDARPESYRDPVAVAREVHAEGGLVFVAHLDTSQVTLDDWSAAAPDGLEVANLHTAAIEAGVMRLGLASALLPGPLALRPLLRTPRALLARWEELPADAIVAGVDAHAKFRLLRWVGTIDTYGRLFHLLTTHVVAREATRPAILEALRAGDSYVAFEGREPVDHFEFALQDGRASIAAPRPAELALICDGARSELGVASEASAPLPSGAVRCRAEAWLDGELWIATSYRRVAEPTRSPAATRAASEARSETASPD